MKHTLLIAIFASLLIACNSNKEKTTTGNNTGSEKTSAVDCYQYANNNDTITLKLIHVGQSITGTLVYKFHEKDNNRGTIQGGMRGDTLIADYTFMSEGVQSVRQVVFIKEQDSFIEGHGDVITNGDRVVFKDPGSLRFDGPVKLSAIGCLQ